MTAEEYRSELEKLLDEIRSSMIVDENNPMTVHRAIGFAHAIRKEGMILAEIDEVEEMTVAYDLPHRFAELLKALDAVGA